MLEQTGPEASEEPSVQLEAARGAFEEAGQLVVDADQAQEDAQLARQEADRLSRSDLSLLQIFQGFMGSRGLGVLGGVRGLCVCTKAFRLSCADTAAAAAAAARE